MYLDQISGPLHAYLHASHTRLLSLSLNTLLDISKDV